MRASTLLTLPAVLCAGTAAAAQGAPPQVDLEQRVIAVADIANLKCAAGSDLCDRSIAIVPAGANTVTLSEARRRELLRRHFPLARMTLRHKGTVTFHAPSADRSIPARRCLKLRDAIQAGEYIVAKHVEPTACRAESSTAAVRYDRGARAVRATANLDRGTYLGPLEVRNRRPFAAGSTLTLVARSGSVELRREVRLMQSGRPGRAAFVQTGDGEVFPVPLSGGEEGE